MIFLVNTFLISKETFLKIYFKTKYTLDHSSKESTENHILTGIQASIPIKNTHFDSANS